ncbi:MAG TPA: hypothetical protein DCP20_01055 [Coriobacteriia bacterium]|nr:hypothetical protein [Coriobacteriia bacterium]
MTLRDDLAQSHAKALRRASLFGLASGLALVIAIPLVPVEIFIVGPPIFLIVALVLLAPALPAGAQRVDVIRELEARGVDGGTAISPFTGKPDPRAAMLSAVDLDRAALQRLRLPGTGTAVLFVLVLLLTAVIVITHAPDSSWLFAAVFTLFTVLAAFFVWTIVVLASLGQLKRRLP